MLAHSFLDIRGSQSVVFSRYQWTLVSTVLCLRVDSVSKIFKLNCFFWICQLLFSDSCFRECSVLISFVSQGHSHGTGLQNNQRSPVVQCQLTPLCCWAADLHHFTSSSSCLSATILTCCSAGFASWAGVSSASKAASRCRSPCIMSPKRCATKSAKTHRPPPLPLLERQGAAPSGARPSSPSSKIRTKRHTWRNYASTTLNQRKVHASGLQGMNTAMARAFGWKWLRSVPHKLNHVVNDVNQCTIAISVLWPFITKFATLWEYKV